MSKYVFKMRYSLILIVIGLLVLTSIDRFVGVNAEVSDKEIDSRAVSVLRGAITHVRDGDTFEVSGKPVRISALDCPENSTSSGQKATQFTRQFKGKQAVCELTGAKTYDRVVGYCSIEGKDFAQIMVENKFCKFWPKYDVWKRYLNGGKLK
jgi:endonuclease YncB( thermonuclease family)